MRGVVCERLLSEIGMGVGRRIRVVSDRAIASRTSAASLSMGRVMGAIHTLPVGVESRRHTVGVGRPTSNGIL